MPRCQGDRHINAILRANLEWSNPKIGRKLRDLNTTWQTGPNNIKEPISGSSSITLSVPSVTWYGAQHNLT